MSISHHVKEMEEAIIANNNLVSPRNTQKRTYLKHEKPLQKQRYEKEHKNDLKLPELSRNRNCISFEARDVDESPDSGNKPLQQ